MGHDEAAIGECGAHPLAALFEGACGEPDDCPHGQAQRDVHLDGDVVGVDAKYGGGADGGEHEGSVPRRRCSFVIERTRGAAKIAAAVVAFSQERVATANCPS